MEWEAPLGRIIVSSMEGGVSPTDTSKLKDNILPCNSVINASERRDYHTKDGKGILSINCFTPIEFNVYD